MEERICPIMSRQDNKYQQPYFINCQKEKCMAWGKWSSAELGHYGCKLIERGYREKHP